MINTSNTTELDNAHLQDESHEFDNLTDSTRAFIISNTLPRQEQRTDETSETASELYPVPLSLGSTDENDDIVVTSIRASDVAFGLRRLPVGFYVVLYHNGLEWRTENKPPSVNNNVVEWSGPIPISSDLSAIVHLEVYASFEFQPMLGSGEQLRKLASTAGQLLDRSAKDAPFMFFPEDEDVVSPCSSIVVTVERRKREKSDTSGSKAIGPHWSTTEPQGELEDATNLGHSTLSRYRKHGRKRDLEHSIEHFERALNVCPRDHPCRAAAQSNLGMARLILSQVEDTYAPLEVVLRLYRDALAARPSDHPDRPLTLIQLASVHLARLKTWRDRVDEANGENAEGLLHEAMELSTAESYGKRAATLMLQLCSGHMGSRTQSDCQSSAAQDSTPSLTEEDPRILGVWLLRRFEQFGDIADLQRAVTILERLVGFMPKWDHGYCVALGNLGTALSYRFKRLGELSDLEDAISTQREAVHLTPRDHPHKPAYLTNLGISLQTRFEHLGQPDDLEDAISFFNDAIHLTPREHPHRPGYLNNLGASFQTRFERLGQLSDLENAISRKRDAVDLTPDDHPKKPRYLNNLGNSFQLRFKRLGQLSDIEDAISNQRDAVHLTPDDHPNKATRLSNLGTSFQIRFERLGQLNDLEDAISRMRDAVHLTPRDHPHKPAYLTNLGISLQTRFERLGQLRDLEDATWSFRDVVHLAPDDDPHKPSYLINLGNSFQSRFERFGQLSDLEGAISAHKDAVHLTPDDHPKKPMCLSNLGTSFKMRFQRLGQLSDLEDMISSFRDAIRLTSRDHPDRPGYLDGLGNSFQARFQRFGQLSDLEDAISTQRDAVHFTPDDHPAKPLRLGNLGVSLQSRFERLGQLGDLEDAISTQRDAVHLTPDDHLDKPLRLSNLGVSFGTRFERLGQLGDLEDAILSLRDAVHLTPRDHPDRPGYLNNLGVSLQIRFERLGQLNDLEDAISRKRDAVYLTPRDHPRKPECLSNLGNSLQVRFRRLGQLSDLEDAISTQKEAIHLIPRDHPDKPGYLNNLGTSFQARFELLGQLSALDDAMSSFKDAVCLAPGDHPHKPRYLHNLAKSFAARFLRLGRLSDIEHALSLSSYVASIPNGAPSVRWSAAQRWIQCARLARHPSLLHAYSVAVSLMPQLAWIGLSLSHRYDELTRSAGVVREAAAAALDAGFPQTALEWLEQGRSIVWGDLFQLRSSYEELSSAYPDHASRLYALSARLDQANGAREQSLSTLSEQNQSGTHHTAESRRQVADRHRSLAIERDKLLREIRQLPGFEKFLLHKPFSQLRAAAHSGPVVILNAAETRCDALIVVANVSHVIHVPLPNFTSGRCTNLQVILKGFVRETRTGKLGRREDITWDHILSPLWKCIVKPVLDALAFSAPPEDLSRIFWCPTGPLAFLPIHAAGFHNEQYSEPGHKVFDFVVSSYVPSLATLISSPSSATTPSGNFRLLLVPQPPSDGQSKLPGVALELRRINRVVSNSPLACTTLEPSDGTVEEVLDLMKHADWVHFACHGVQDGVDSGLCLANGCRLKLRDIVALSRPRGGLAFLSACQTAKGEQHLSDEAIHIAAGMLFAGYGGVIGTMWSISDAVAPDVANDVYEELLGKGSRADYQKAAWALHEATKDLRKRGKSFDEWIPFIHVGL